MILLQTLNNVWYTKPYFCPSWDDSSARPVTVQCSVSSTETIMPIVCHGITHTLWSPASSCTIWSGDTACLIWVYSTKKRKKFLHKSIFATNYGKTLDYMMTNTFPLQLRYIRVSKWFINDPSMSIHITP